MGKEFNEQPVNREKLAFASAAINSCPDKEKWQGLKERVLSNTDVRYIIEDSVFDEDTEIIRKLIDDYYNRFPICVPLYKLEKIEPAYNPSDPANPYVYEAYAKVNKYRDESERYLFTKKDNKFFKKQYLAAPNLVLEGKDLFCFGKVIIKNFEVGRE